MRGFLKFSHFVASKSTVSFEFCHEPHNLLPQNRCFARGFRQFSSHLTKCHVCPEIFTLTSPDAALTMRSVKKNAQYNTSEVLRLPREMTMEVSKVMHLPRKNATHLGKTTQKCCACHTKRLWTHYETCWNVTKSHACLRDV